MMDFHLIGCRPSSLTPLPKSEGNSLAVLQWMELVRGERVVMRPANPFQVETVLAEERYCFHCLGVRWADVARDVMQQVLLMRCRCCGKERAV